MLHKVVALGTYEKMKLVDKELGFRPKEGFEFEVSDERLDLLLGNNTYHVPFVRLADKVEEVAEDDKVEQPIEEKPKKRGRKKKE